MPFDYAVHSDLLIHWTGSDIEKRYKDEKPWWKNESSETRNPLLVKEYLERLRNILEHGLWMTPTTTSTPGGGDVETAEVARVCFTELKLSQSRIHARRYGRLGIGVKRPFAFERGGRPVVYFDHNEKHRRKDVFLQACSDSFERNSFLHFFKPMSSSGTPRDSDSGESPLSPYDFYAESEWRILATPELVESLNAVDPTRSPSPELDRYLRTLRRADRDKLRYLLPLDKWLSCIIYPSVALKIEAYKDPKIRELLDGLPKISTRLSDHIENKNSPVEMDLDLCRNF